MTTTTHDLYDRLESAAAGYGVTMTRVERGGLSGAIAESVESPAVGTPLPWEGVSLPEEVTTDPSPAAMTQATTGVTPASLAIADYGSLVLWADQHASEPVSLFPQRHVAVLCEDDIVPDMGTAFEWFGEQLRDTRGSAIIATGPSATADMGSLVQGAHGPETVEVLVIP